jgi:hypothetical protein
MDTLDNNNFNSSNSNNDNNCSNSSNNNSSYTEIKTEVPSMTIKVAANR